MRQLGEECETNQEISRASRLFLRLAQSRQFSSRENISYNMKREGGLCARGDAIPIQPRLKVGFLFSTASLEIGQIVE
jgi:hypothetical protein